MKFRLMSALLIMSCQVRSSVVTYQEEKDGELIRTTISHTKANEAPGEGEELVLDHYTPVPLNKVIHFTRPLNSDFQLASRWKSFRINQMKDKVSPVKQQVQALETDIFLVYPFQVFKGDDGVLRRAILALTAYRVAAVTSKAERTGLLIRVSDDNIRVKIKVEQIHTDEPKADCTVKVESTGHTPVGKKKKEDELGDATKLAGDDGELNELADKTQINNDQATDASLEMETNDNIEISEYEYTGVTHVHFNAAIFTEVTYAPYILADYTEGYFSVEQIGPVIVHIKVEGPNLNIVLAKKNLAI